MMDSHDSDYALVSEMTFTVKVTQDDEGGCRVHVSDQSGEKFATVTAGDMWTALEMALPYMAATAEPDPFTALIQAYREKVTRR